MLKPLKKKEKKKKKKNKKKKKKKKANSMAKPLENKGKKSRVSAWRKQFYHIQFRHRQLD